nr:DR3 [Zea mays]
MELALGAMASLAPKLGDLLMEEYVVQKGLKPDIESLSRELVMMNAALVDASRVPPDQLTEVEKLWARKVRDLSYDMEDAVDDFILRVAGGDDSAADSKFFKKTLAMVKDVMSIKKFMDRRQISDKVKDIKKLSNELAELRDKYTVRGVGADLAASTGIDPRVINLYKKETDLVGIQESRDKVIRMLSMETKDDDAHESHQDLKIVSIVGVGGLGKTTLAKTVYEYDMVKKQFDCSAFISIGRTPNLNRTFEKMLLELDHEYKQVDMARWDLEQFKNELDEFLKDKRYLIVVDDIWDDDSWKAVKYALKDNSCGSRVIMTTRNSGVVTKVEEVYRLKPLSNENSKKLFYKRIQSQEGESFDGELSSKIIHKCGGIPLAIIAIASLLVERSREEWSEVYDKIGFGNEDNTAKIMSYSYYDLPPYLKPCLLQLSIFPEDCFIDTKAVIWMWIGEGLVHLEKEEGSLFEVGERYFKELVNRSMIQPIEEKYHWFVERFCIHDIMFDLICKLSKDEDFITLSGQHSSQSLQSLFNLRSDCKLRRLAVRNQRVQRFPEETMDMPEVLRSLSIIDCNIEVMATIDSFRVCRVLHIENNYVPISLKHLGKLLHLKFLEIFDTTIDELPREIGHLRSLQTLVLVSTGLDELPVAVCSLTRLMCLIAYGFERLPADRIGNLTSLEELQLHRVVGRSATQDLVAELGKLTRLRVVRITFSEQLEESSQEALVQSLSNLRLLQELVLFSEMPERGSDMWGDWELPRQLRCLIIGAIVFSRQPRWINRSCLPRLCSLYLRVHALEAQGLDNLARLPELQYLMLYGYSWPPRYTVGPDDFRNLRFCEVGTTFELRKGAMPRLEELQFGVFAGYWSWEQYGVPFEQFPTKDVFEDLDLDLDNVLLLQQVRVKVDCSGATVTQVEEVEAVVMRAVENHANRPTIKMDRVYEQNILSDEEREALLRRHIEEDCCVRTMKDKSDAFFISQLRLYQHLQEATIFIVCSGASMCEVQKVEAACRHAAEVHPNHPSIKLIRTKTDEMASSSSDHPNTEPRN